jgi:peptide/nickel transport system substrate-binding protein
MTPRFRLRYPIGLAVIFAVVAFCAGCGSGGSSPASSGTSASASAPPHSGGTLRIAEAEGIDNLNSSNVALLSEANVLEQIIEPMFRVEGNGQVQPWLVKSYKKSPDLQTWTFTLKPEVKFSNGKQLTAKDVVFSLETIKKSVIWGSLYETIKSIEAPSPATVVIHTSEPSPSLPATLGIFSAGIIPDNYNGMSQQQFWEHPIGSGPFVFESWQRGQSVTLAKNPKYWAKPAYLDKVVYVIATDDNSRVQQLKAGGLDVIASPPWAGLASLESTSGIEVAEAPNSWVGGLTLNAENPLLADSRAREAVNLALDRAAVVKVASGGKGEVAMPNPPLSVLYADESLKPPSRDVQQASALLEEAVADTGAKPNLQLLFVGEQEYSHLAAQIIQQNLEEAGFEITLQPRDAQTVTQEEEGGHFDLAVLNSTSLLADPVEWFAYFDVTEGFFSKGSAAKTYALIPEAASEPSPKKREQLYHELQQRIAKENYNITINDQPNLYAHSSSVQNLNVTAKGLVRLSEVWLSE